MFDHFLAANPAWEAYFQTDDPGSASAPGPGLHNIDPGPKLPNTRAGYVSRWSPA